MRSTGCVLVLFALTNLLAAPAAEERPKVGLALSGGGALGLAHIGVIQWLEKNRIPIDYVAGTSMGGLIGGAYAAGMSGEEIQELIESIDWAGVLRGAPDYGELGFRRKQDRREYPIGIELGLRRGFRLPEAFNPGHEAGLIFDRIALPYSAMESFDELPTPFRCVAVDLISGEEIVLSEGGLGNALRATMAIPGVFAPVKRDEMMLVDGGLLNNLPVDVVIDMGAEIVIAVDVGDAPVEAKDLESIIGVADRAISVMIRVNVNRNAARAQYVIRPELKGFRSLDFSEPGKMIEKGRAGSEDQTDALRSLQLDEAGWRQHQKRRRGRTHRRGFRPEFIRVRGETGRDAPRLKQALAKHEKKPLQEDEFERELTRITGWGPYDKASYARQEEAGEEGLEVAINHKIHGPPFIRPVVKINAGQTGDVTFEVAARMTAYHLFQANNELRVDASFGHLNLLGAELYQYLGDTSWFVAPRGFGQYETQFLYQQGERVADYGITDLGVGADLGYNFGSSELRAGYQYGYQKANVRSGSPLLPTTSGPASSVTGQWRLDRLNSEMVHTRGIAALTRATWQINAPGSTGRTVQMESRLQGAIPVNDRWTTQWAAAGGATGAGDAGPIQKFTVGGPARVGALGLDERRGNHYVYTSAGVLRLLKENPGGLVSKVFLGGWYEGGDAFDNNPHWVHSGSAGITGETRLGLIYVGGSFGAGNLKFYLSLGKFF